VANPRGSRWQIEAAPFTIETQKPHLMLHPPRSANRFAITGRLAAMALSWASTWAMAAPASISLPGKRAYRSASISVCSPTAKHDLQPHVPFRLFAVALAK
jgi:hypothetical protein